MRTKSEILKDSQDHKQHVPKWDSMAALHERLQIEVLIDIRDELSVIKKDLVDLNEYLSLHA